MECVGFYTVGDIMVSSIIAVGPGDSIMKAARLMAEKEAESILVVDRDGGLVGILTEHDLVKAVTRGLDLDTPVEKLVTRSPVTAEPGEPLATVLCKMLRHRVYSVPVVVDRKPVGIVSIKDIASVWAAEQQLCTTG